MWHKDNFYKILLVFSIIVAAISSCYLVIDQLNSKKNKAGEGGTQSLNEYDIGGEFCLTNFDNQKFTNENLKGKISILYFGFSFCPDVCPESLAKFVKIKNVLEKYAIDVNIVFITIDPKRDTAEVLKSYLGFFHKDFIGLTGTEKEIEEISKKFKVYFAIAPQDSQSDNEDYMLDHSSFSYVLNKNGDFIKVFYLKSSAEEMIEFILMQNKKY
ncbi:MAG: SCO family protein [Rickettsia sp.]|nr:SCO family protein [Rickettsia sp.]